MLRIQLLFMLLLLPTAATAAVDYQLDINLIPAAQRLVATALIAFEPPGGENISLRLAENCEIVSVLQTGKRLDYTFETGVLQVELMNSEPLRISYRGQFAATVTESPVHNEDPSYGISASISEKGTYLSAGTNWYPRLDEEKIHYQISIEAPAGTEAITSGRRIERRTDSGRSRSTWQVDYPLSGLTLSAGGYRVFEDMGGKVPIYAYFYPGSAALAATYLTEARSYLQLYEELFGPYPFHKFAIVENFFPTGYGLPSWTLLGSSVIKLPFIVKTSLGHEIAHSWWGNGVRIDYAQGNWSEGLTTYVADYLYKERSSAVAARDYRLKLLRGYASLVNAQNAFALRNFRSRHDKASQAIGYGKTALLFHMLRQRVGEETFWSSLKQIAVERMFSQVGWDDFARIFSANSGQPLTPLFHQWLSRAEGPNLALEDVSRTPLTDGWLVSGKLVQPPPFYRLRVELQLLTEQEPLSVVAEIEDAEQPFQFHLSAKPLRLTADPDADLFRILAPEEIPSTVNAIRGSDHLLILRGGQNVPPADAQQMLLGAMRKSSLPTRTLAEVTQTELATHDLMIFGTPQELLPAGVIASASAAQVQLPERTAPLKNHSTFIVTRNPFNKQRHAAWFVSRDTKQSATAARKIPHYGKYSYLLFEGDNNLVKGIWDVQKSPMKVDFQQD